MKSSVTVEKDIGFTSNSIQMSSFPRHLLLSLSLLLSAPAAMGQSSPPKLDKSIDQFDAEEWLIPSEPRFPLETTIQGVGFDLNDWENGNELLAVEALSKNPAITAQKNIIERPKTNNDTENSLDSAANTDVLTIDNCVEVPDEFDLFQETIATNPESIEDKPPETLPNTANSEKPPIASSYLPQPIQQQKQPSNFQTLAKADHYYRCGETHQAETLYREVKPLFAAEKALERDKIPQAVYEPSELSAAGQTYWRLYEEGLENERYQSKRQAALKLLVEHYPEFIPGQLLYYEWLQETDEGNEADQLLQTAIAHYPNEADVIEAKIKADEEAERWIEASLAARQFALFNPDHFLAVQFVEMAETNLARYRGQLNDRLVWNTVGSALLGGIGYALTGRLTGPLSALEASYLLLQDEADIGDRFADQIKRELTLITDPEVNSYVTEIGQKLAAAAGRDEFDYEFFVVEEEALNAFALPGGKIFINAGALVKTNSEAELAGLLAHEIAHAVLSHGYQLIAQGALTINIFRHVPYAGAAAGELIVLNYSREMERQADEFGTRLLATTGYAADGVRNLMAVLEEENNPSPPAWLSTHPDVGDRVQYLEEMIARLNLNRYLYEGVVEHARISDRVEEILKVRSEETSEN